MPAIRISETNASRRSAARPNRWSRIAAVAGLVGRRTARGVARRPVASASIAAFGVFFAALAGNALWGQTGRHAAPFIATRAPHGVVETTGSIGDPTHLAQPLVQDVQRALAEAGYYRAAIDGRPGPATMDAIRRFQSVNGLTATGEATPLLLTQIRQIVASAPNPSPRPYGEEDETSAGRGGRVIDPAQVAMANTAVNEPLPDQIAGAELVKRIQSGLTAASVADLTPDGIVGERTRSAIRTFEALEGMDVTGEPDRRILERLREIGAI